MQHHERKWNKTCITCAQEDQYRYWDDDFWMLAYDYMTQELRLKSELSSSKSINLKSLKWIIVISPYIWLSAPFSLYFILNKSQCIDSFCFVYDDFVGFVAVFIIPGIDSPNDQNVIIEWPTDQIMQCFKIQTTLWFRLKMSEKKMLQNCDRATDDHCECNALIVSFSQMKLFQQIHSQLAFVRFALNSHSTNAWMKDYEFSFVFNFQFIHSVSAKYATTYNEFVLKT